MVRGIREKSPCDAKEREKYYARRAKNNESARKHRDRTREKAEGYDRLKELCEKLKAELEQTTRRIEELEKENLMFRNVFLTPENMQSSLQRSHCSACRSEHHHNAKAAANYPQLASSRFENTPYSLPEPNQLSSQPMNRFDSYSSIQNLRNATSSQLLMSNDSGSEAGMESSTFYVTGPQRQPVYHQQSGHNYSDLNKDDYIPICAFRSQFSNGNSLQHFFTPYDGKMTAVPESAKNLSNSQVGSLDNVQNFQSETLNKNLTRDQLIDALQALMASQRILPPVNSDLRHFNVPESFVSLSPDLSSCFTTVSSF